MLTNGSTYNPLCFAQDPIWMEWVAAMYETMQADEEPNSGYARTSMTLAEEIEEDTDELLNEDYDIPPNAGSAS